jgi:hypothetical protein
MAEYAVLMFHPEVVQLNRNELPQRRKSRLERRQVVGIERWAGGKCL